MLKKLMALLLLLVCAFGVGMPVSAAEYTQSTGYTQMMTINREKEISQDAYLPSGAYLDLGLSDPQDIYIQGRILYIADTGNGRVLAVNLDTDEVKVIGSGVLGQPTGVSVDDEGNIYVADSGNAKAYRFSSDGTLAFTFEKPDSPNFGKNTGYKPTKVAHAEAGGVYLVSEGSQAGILHISGTGEFLGFFASNEVATSLFEKFVDLILTEEQKSSFLKKTPPSFGNIFRGADGLVYTTNKGKETLLKRHSISGLNMLAKAKELPAIDNPVDLFVTKEGRIFIADEYNVITEITSDGYFLCSFGGSAEGTDRSGLFELISGLAVDNEENVYVLDKEKNAVQIFAPTPFQKNIHQAMTDYQNGMYDDSQAILDEVLKFNNTSFFAHMYSGKNYMQKGEYELAAEHFQIANSKDDYSDAYWEIRNIWLQNNLMYVFAVLIILAFLWWLVGLLRRKTNLLQPIGNLKDRLLENRFVSDMAKIKYGMLHPIDNAYYIKRGKNGTYLSAFVIYALLFILLVLYQVASGFIFAQDMDDYSIVNVFLGFVVVTFLFLISHFLISSINDGLGGFRDITLVIAYSCSPLIVFVPFIIIFANFATVDEKFFIDFALMVLFIWCICNMIVGLIEIHEYKFSTIVGNILVTLFTMGVAVLAASVGYLLVRQIINFIYELIVEVGLRV